MDPDDSQEDEGPVSRWMPPEDRLWRHPSEVGPRSRPAGRGAAAAAPERPRTWAVALCSGAIGALLVIGLGLATGNLGHHTVLRRIAVPTPATVSLAVSAPQISDAPDWSSIADSVAPSVVAIGSYVSSGEEFSSGVVLTTSRGRTYVLTAADVTGDANRIVVTFDNGRTERAHVVGNDPTSDVALLWVRGTHPSPTFASVSSITVADPVLAVGARSAGNASVGTGSVTGLDEQLDAAGNVTLTGMVALSGGPMPDATDGGALVDSSGAVVGIETDLTSVVPADQGVTYAIPIDTARCVAIQLLEGHRPVDPWIGIDNATDLTTAVAGQLGISGGAQIGTVTPGSPAAAAHLKPNDIVTAFDGRPVTSSGALIRLVDECHAGERTTIRYFQGSRRHEARITVVSEPSYSG